MKKFLIVSLAIICLTVFGIAMAEPETSPSPTATSDAQSLQVKDPKILPDSKLYFLKEFQRKVKLALTFNPVKKAEIAQQIANEKLVELEKLATKTQNAKILEKATAAFNKQTEQVKNMVEKVKDAVASNPQAEKFITKVVEQAALQTKILQKLESQVPSEVFTKIQEARQEHVERFGQVMEKVGKIKDNIIKKNPEIVCITLWKPVCGSDGKTYSNECFAEAAGVRVVSQGACGNEQNKYLKCGGVQEIVCPEGYRCQIPAVYPDAMGTCVPIQGCQKKPVCKAIGTRSEGWYDSCTDKLIRYESCGQETTPLPTSTSASPGSGMDCKTLWWFDNEHKFCQQSKKCGAYMYFGLHTFETKEACEKSLTE